MIYLDTAALVKLVRHEPESTALVSWLRARAEQPWLSSALSEIELPRALRRTEPDLLDVVPIVLGRLHRYDIDETVRATAAGFSTPALRSLDAIHLATAVVLGGQLSSFVTYDGRLLEEARALGLPATAPA